jgi:SAM-dependent methyltransferase
MFSSREEWVEFHRENSALSDHDIIKRFAASIRRTGFRYLDKVVEASKVELVDGDYRDSFVYEGLASHSRAVLLEFFPDFRGKKIGPKKVRIYTPNARSGLASLLAEYFPKLQSSGYLRYQEQRNGFTDAEHQDLAELTYEDACFDYAVVDDLFQYLPNLDAVLGEFHRVLAPGGVLFATFPFAVNSEDHLVNATLNADGSISYPLEQEHQRDRIDEQQPVVFQVPGWSILTQCRDLGFGRADFVLLSSPRRGVLASDTSGVFVLRAEKPA